MSEQSNGNPILEPATIGGSATDTTTDFDFDGRSMDWNELETDINIDVRPLAEQPSPVTEELPVALPTGDTESWGETSTTCQWMCDVCQVSIFPTLVEAGIHELACQRAKDTREQAGGANPTILALNLEFPTHVVAAEPETTLFRQPVPVNASVASFEPSSDHVCDQKTSGIDVIPSARPSIHRTCRDVIQDGNTNIVEAMDDSKSSVLSDFTAEPSNDETNAIDVLEEAARILVVSQEASASGLGLHTNTSLADISLGTCAGINVNMNDGRDKRNHSHLRLLAALPDVASPSLERSQTGSDTSVDNERSRMANSHHRATNNTADGPVSQDSVAKLPVPETILSMGTLHPNLPSTFLTQNTLNIEAIFIGAKPSFKGSKFRFDWSSGMWRAMELTTTAENSRRARERSLACPKEEIDLACALFQSCYGDNVSNQILFPRAKHLGLLFLRYQSQLVNVVACVVPGSTERSKAVEIVRVATRATHRKNGFARLAMTLILKGISDLAAQKHNKVFVNGFRNVGSFYSKCGFGPLHMANHYEAMQGGSGHHLLAFQIELKSKKVHDLMKTAVQKLRPHCEGEDTVSSLSPLHQDAEVKQETPTVSDRKRSRSKEGRYVQREKSVGLAKDDPAAHIKRESSTYVNAAVFRSDVEGSVLPVVAKRHIEPARKPGPKVEQSRTRSSRRLIKGGEEDVLKRKCDVLNNLVNSAHSVGDSVLVAWRGKFFPGTVEKVTLMAYTIRWLDGSGVNSVDKGTYIFSGNVSITP